MNAVEIEEAVSALADQPFDRAEFPYAFLKRSATRRRRSSGCAAARRTSPTAAACSRPNNIHIAVCAPGEVDEDARGAEGEPGDRQGQGAFILATDGEDFEAEDLTSGETVACAYKDFPDHFGFFLPLAGITTVKQIRENSFDIRATGRLNRLYVELLKDNPEWGTAERRHDMNHFMARLIFCFFAEKTDIFTATACSPTRSSR